MIAPERAEQHVQRLRAEVDAALAALVTETEPAALYEPVQYALAGQGKRFRPILLLLAAEAFRTPAERALPAALSVEVFHTFTLVHDDIMDKSDERRGRPAVHVRWDESTAILCGDYLMALAYQQLAQTRASNLADLFEVYHVMVRRLCEGQTLDEQFETQADVTVAQYLDMIDRKTGALVQASLVLGGMLGGARAGACETLQTIGLHIGRAFQIQDDLLDLTAQSAKWGKPIGGDLLEGKKTFLLLKALEVAHGADHAWFARIVENKGLSAGLIPEARQRMTDLGVLATAEAAIAEHTEAALACLQQLPQHPARETLQALILRMQRRRH